MTLELAFSYMAQLDRVNHRTPFTWRDVATDGQRGTVTLVTLADTPTVQRWFACVDLHAIRFERNCKAHAWKVTFQIMPMEGNS